MPGTPVVIEGGGKNLYSVAERSGAFHIYKDGVFTSDKHIGTAASMNDALAFIQRHSGHKIKSIG